MPGEQSAARIQSPELPHALLIETFTDPRPQAKTQQVQPDAFKNRSFFANLQKRQQFIGQCADKPQGLLIAGKINDPPDTLDQFLHLLLIIAG